MFSDYAQILSGIVLIVSGVLGLFGIAMPEYMRAIPLALKAAHAVRKCKKNMNSEESEHEEDPGHVELHVMPLADPLLRRVILKIGGEVHSDASVRLRDLPAECSRLLMIAAMETDGGRLSSIYRALRR